MKRCVLALILLIRICQAQEWQAEVMTGFASYNGDLSQRAFSPRSVRPAVALNMKYEFYYLVIRGGIAWAQLAGDDKFNKDVSYKSRNLSFRTNVWEASLCAELNLVEPDLFYAYPYLFAGVGVFKYDPYAFDNEGKKVKLHPLRTEGQGLPEYPDRKKYSLTQFNIPVGGGWKWRFNKTYDLAFEFGYRVLFTDYLDDVSKNYVSGTVLTNRVGPKAAEMANRAKPIPGSGATPGPGEMRGNPGVKDSYFFSGIKLIMHINGRQE